MTLLEQLFPSASWGSLLPIGVGWRHSFLCFFPLPKERPNWNALSTKEKILVKFFPLAKAIKSDIITAGRDDASARAFPLCLGKPPID